MNNNTHLLRAIAALDSGRWTYVDGDLEEIRHFCDEIGTFLVSDVGNGQCKVTKVKVQAESFYGMMAKHMDGYSGTPVLIIGDVTKTRMAVSRYNKLKGKTFSVRAVNESSAEVYSSNIGDFASITMEMFEAEVAKKVDEIKSLRKLVKDANNDELDALQSGITSVEFDDEVDEDKDEDLTPDPRIFVTKPHYDPLPEIEAPQNWKLANCTNCGEEFTTLNKDQIWCEDCINDDEDIV